MMKKEIEYLSLLTKHRHDELLQVLRATLDYVSEQNITSIWYVEDINTEYVKLDHNHTGQTAKLVYKKKNGTERQEYEVPVNIDEVSGLDTILRHALKGQRYVTEQQRYDFKTTDGLSIALKHTTDMKWHVEIEAESSLEPVIAHEHIHLFAQKHNLMLLSEEEEKKLYNSLIAKRSSKIAD